MSLPYRIVLIAALLTGVAFGLGPWWTLRQITMASVHNDTEAWQRLVNEKDIQVYTGQLLNGLMELKLFNGMRETPRDALHDYQQAREQLPLMLQKLSQPQALPQLVCGEVFGNADMLTKAGDCWALDGEIHWQSPLQAHVVFTHPQTHWQSSLILLRTGLFSWRLDSIDLPIDAMLERLAVLTKDDAV